MEDDFQYYYIDQDIKQSRPWNIFYGTTQRIMKIQGIFTFQEILQSLRPQGSNHCKVQVS